MKKALILFVLLLLTGCGQQINTCNVKTKELEQKWKYVSKNDKVKEIELEIIYDNSIFENIDSFESLNDDQKEALKKQILVKLGFEKNNYEGLNIEVTVNKEIAVIVKVDYNKAKKELLTKIGMNLEDDNINNIMANMKTNGATCK